MAYTALTVLPADIDGDELIALMVAANTQGADGFQFANDGRTMLLVLDQLAAGAGDTITFEGLPDKYGRSESPLTRTVTAKKIFAYGPFLPELWNKTGGVVRFKFTTAAATTAVIAIQVANPQ
jgi:hypothetical protein